MIPGVSRRRCWAGGALSRPAAALAIAMLMGGCVEVPLREMELHRLRDESASIADASGYLASQPSLGEAYDGRAFVSAAVFNRLLASLDGYEFPLADASGARIRFARTRLAFNDGAPTAVIDAFAVAPGDAVQIRLRIRAQVGMTSDAEASELGVHFSILEMLPDAQLSPLRWPQYRLGMAVLKVPAQQVREALPRIRIALRADAPIAVEPVTASRVEMNNGKAWIDVNQTLPRFKLDYSYRVLRVVTLKDGVHVFFSMQRKGA